MDAATLVTRFPRLWHMAEDGSWPSIQSKGLLSTSSLLNLYKISGAERSAIEARHRPQSVPIDYKGLPRAVVRDQKPMSDAALAKCLRDDLKPEDWSRLLNSMSFFWLSTDRLFRLLNAKPYRNLAHTVLTVDSASFVKAHHQEIRLCPMNSGCTKPFPWPRGKDTFLPIDEYPYEQRLLKNRKEPVVELAVLNGVFDISRHTISVHRMQGQKVLEEMYRRPGTGAPVPF